MACGLVLVALLVADSIASYLAVRRVQSAVNGFSNLRAYPELNRSVKNQRPYEPPASDELTSSQLAQLLRVQEVAALASGSGFQRSRGSTKSSCETTTSPPPRTRRRWSPPIPTWPRRWSTENARRARLLRAIGDKQGR